MARRIESHMLAGPVGKLECLLEEPEEGEPTGAALVCHPHPQHGGTMHNKVVYRIARALRRSGQVVLRFNYRGVNLSEGAYDHGLGETEDARCALDWLRGRYPELPFQLAGFSFGSRVAVRLGCDIAEARKLILVGYPARYPDHESLLACTKSKVFIHSTHDELSSQEELTALVSHTPEPKQVLLVSAEDHFFKGALDEFERVVESVAYESV